MESGRFACASSWFSCRCSESPARRRSRLPCEEDAMADAVHTAIGFNDPFAWLVTRITPANMAEMPESVAVASAVPPNNNDGYRPGVRQAGTAVEPVVHGVVERERHVGAKH